MSDYHASGCMSCTHNQPANPFTPLTGEREIKLLLAVLDLDRRHRDWEAGLGLADRCCMQPSGSCLIDSYL